jgi:thiol:disulfide interchange protein DsbD
MTGRAALRIPSRWAWLVVLATLSAGAAARELPDFGGASPYSPTGPFTHRITLDRPAAGRGGSSAVLARLTIPAQTHLAVDEKVHQPRIEVAESPAGLRFGAFEAPPPTKLDLDLTPTEKDPAKKVFEKGSPVYQKEVTLRLPFTVAADAAPGERRIQVALLYSGCQDAPQYKCFLPATVRTEQTFTVTDAVETPASSPMPAAPASAESLPALPPRGEMEELAQAFASGHLLALLWALFFAGLASFLLPCVYPLVPITLGIVGVRKAATRWQAAALAGSYGLGIVVVYVLLGLVSGVAGGQFDQFIDRPWVVLSISALCVALAFSMFGAFELALPGAWQTRLAGFGGGGYAGGFLMGAVSGLLASACVGPALVFILLLIAQQGSPALGALLLFVYGLGFALPYVVIGATAARLPKPGVWMVTVKKTGGLILLGVAIYYASKVLPGWTTFLLAGVALVTTGIFAGALDPLTAESGVWPRVLKSFGIIALALGLFFLLDAASRIGAPGLPGAETAPAEGGEIVWQESPAHALEAAARQNRPVILDFVSDTCTVCREIEKTTFRDPRVVKRSQDFVMVRVDTSDGRNRDVAERYRVKGLPTILFVDRDGRERMDLAVQGGYLGADEFLKKMSALLPPLGNLAAGR